MNEHSGRFLFLIPGSGFVFGWTRTLVTAPSMFIHYKRVQFAAHRSERWLCVTARHQWSWKQDYLFPGCIINLRVIPGWVDKIGSLLTFKAIGHFRYRIFFFKVHRFTNNLQGLKKVMVKDFS